MDIKYCQKQKQHKKSNLERNVFFILEKHVFIKKLTPLEIDVLFC